MKFTSHKAVYSILPKRLQELPNTLLDNYIIQCVRQIDAHTMYEKKIKFIQITNGVGELPEDFVRSLGLFYKTKSSITDEELNSIVNCLTEEAEGCIDDLHFYSTTNTVPDEFTPSFITERPGVDSFADRYKLIKIRDYDNEGNPTEGYIMRNVVVDDYIQSSYMNNCWSVMRIGDVYTGCYTDVETTCKFRGECDLKYTFDKCGHVLTTAPDGYIKIIYLGRVTDSNGDYMIPDNFEYINVIKQGVLSLYWEEMRTESRQGSINNHREYERKFYNGVASLRGTSLLPKGITADRRLRNIIFANIAIANDYKLSGNSAWTGGALYKNLNI